MSERRALFVRKSLIGTCALVAVVLLASFYSVVHGAVDRAARQRLAGGLDSSPHATAIPLQRAGARSGALLAGAGN